LGRDAHALVADSDLRKNECQSHFEIREQIMLRLNVNGTEHTVDIDGSTPLLWVLRDKLGLVGTKFGCGKSFCGACTVHVDGKPVRSCSIQASRGVGRKITTIEGLADDDGTLHPLQEAWIEHDVPQCGYCQAGQIMAAAALLRRNPMPSDADIDKALQGNLCRCGTYIRIRRAIHAAAGRLTEKGEVS
jgi:isoquinoline 1-oxidoreductase alpha subunit